jgi:hypothetical protein
MAGSEYYDHTTYPSQGAVGSSSAARAEFELIEAGFGKAPALAGNGGKLVAVNAEGTAQEALTAAQALAAIGAQATSGKDASGGYAGLTLFKLNLRNAANTFTSFLTNAATAARTWTMPDKDGTVAMTSDFAAPGPIGGTTPAAGAFTTLISSGVAQFSANVALNNAAGAFFYNPGTTDWFSWKHVSTGLFSLSNTAGQILGVSVAGLAITGSLSASTGLTTSGGSLGYVAGAGGTVTQATSKTTGVTLNKPCGTITMHAETLAGGASAVFTFSNSFCNVTDAVIVNALDDFGGVYTVQILSVWYGYFVVRVTNIAGGALAQAVRINFSIIKGAAS